MPFSYELLIVSYESRLYLHPIRMSPISTHLNVLPFGIVVERSLIIIKASLLIAFDFTRLGVPAIREIFMYKLLYTGPILISRI